MTIAKRQSAAMAFSLFLCVALLFWAALLNYSKLGKPAFYIDLRQYPVYGREGFSLNEDSGWKMIAPAGDRELVIVKEKFDVPRTRFLSPFGQKPADFTFRIEFEQFNRDNTIVPALYIGAIGDNWEVYLNGTLIRSEMHLNENNEIVSHRAQRKVWFPFDNDLFISGSNVLDFRVTGDPNYENLGFYYGIPLYISEERYIFRAANEYLPMALIGIYFFIGVYHLLLFLMRPTERYNLFYSLFSIDLGIYFFTRTSIVYHITPDTNIWSRIEFVSMFMFPSLLSAFFDELTRQRLSLPTKIFGIFCAALSLGVFFFAPQFGEDAIIFWWPPLAAYVAYIFIRYFGYSFFYRIYKEWKRDARQGIRRSLIKAFFSEITGTPLGNISIGLLIIFITCAFDIYDSMFLNIGILTSVYGFMVFNLGIAFILARKFGDLYDQLNLANISLEGTVRERTRELEEQTLIAQTASRAKTDFLANMSHEIRTPLNAILGLSELALVKPEEQARTQQLRNIHGSATHLLRLINDILDISKIESGKLELHPKEYDLAGLLNDAISLNTVRIGNKPLAFTLALDETLPSRLYGDDLRIRQIINNLLSNAIKYTESGSIHCIVSPAPGGEGGTDEIGLRIAVSDTGMGIKAEDIDTIFTRFDQGSAYKRNDIEGAGLGLSITRQLAELMNGGITVQSVYGKGSTFTVTIRQATVNAKPVGRELAAALESLALQNRDSGEMNFIRDQMPAARVLVVDDILSNLEVICGFLSLYGMQIDSAESGEHAIRILRKKAADYDLVFMDHMMPGIDGAEVLKILRNDIGGMYAGSLPVIVLSANALVGAREMFLQTGFQDFLSKPVNALALDQILKKWIPEHKIQRAAGTMPSPAATPAVAETPQKLSVAGLAIEGVNTVQGLENSGGDGESYRYMLESFCRDSAEKTNMLRHIHYHFKSAGDFQNVSETVMQHLAMILRTVKNSALSIGAEAIAAEVAALEESLQAGDLRAMEAALPGFCDHLQNVAGSIYKTVSNEHRYIIH